MPMKRTLRRDLDDLRRLYRRAVAERDTARKNYRTERENRRTIGRQLAEAQAAVTRLTGRARRLADRLERVLDEGTDGEHTNLMRRLERMTLAYAGLRETVGTDCTPPADWREERSDLIQRLELANRARRSLAAQCDELRAANDAMSREAVDRAGTLTVAPIADREPGLGVAS